MVRSSVSCRVFFCAISDRRCLDFLSDTMLRSSSLMLLAPSFGFDISFSPFLFFFKSQQKDAAQKSYSAHWRKRNPKNLHVASKRQRALQQTFFGRRLYSLGEMHTRKHTRNKIRRSCGSSVPPEEPNVATHDTQRVQVSDLVSLISRAERVRHVKFDTLSDRDVEIVETVRSRTGTY